MSARMAELEARMQLTCFKAYDIRAKLGVDLNEDIAYAWLDTGTHASLLDASNFVRTLTERQGLQVGSPDEVAFNMRWIGQDQLQLRAEMFGKNSYGKYLAKL